VTITAVQFDRHNAYRMLSRVLFPRRYVGKILLLTFAAAHVPLLALIVYTVFVSGLDAAATITLLVVGLIATLVGTGIAMIGLWVLLTPVVSSSEALERYRSTGVRVSLPVDVPDEGGRLLANVHRTLEGLDTTIAKLQVLVTRDELTGVYNRREGTRRLLEQLEANRDVGSVVTMLLLDADNLKSINDQWGHGTGDCALQRFSDVIVNRVGELGWVSRWGGDEFVAVVQEHGQAFLAERLIEGMLADLERNPLRMAGGEEIWLRLSAGITRNRPGDDLEMLFNRADVALYRAKGMQKHRHDRLTSSGNSVQNPPIP